jgi:hypothetical protein
MPNLSHSLSVAVYERSEEIACPSDIYYDIWDHLPLFYSQGHLNTTLLLIFPDTIEAIDLQAAHLSTTFPKDVASTIQNFRIERPEMEGFAITHEIQLEKNEGNDFHIFVSEVSNGAVLFYRHRDIDEIKIRVAFAQIGGPEFVSYPPEDIVAPQVGIISTLSFDLISLEE